MESLNSYYPDLTKYLTNKFGDSTEEISSYVLTFFEDSIKISSTPLLCVLISFFCEAKHERNINIGKRAVESLRFYSEEIRVESIHERKFLLCRPINRVLVAGSDGAAPE